MKKCLFILVLIMVPAILTAQVFGAGETLMKGKSSVGFNSFFLASGGNEKVYLFIHMDHGIGQACDFDAKIGFTGGETYFGADLEWQLASRNVFVSFTGGAHKFINFGMDAIFNLMLPMGSSGGVYMGADLDVDFVKKEMITPFWLFIGMKINFNRNTYLLMTAEGAMNGDAANIVSAGIKFDL
jgi:hypothetical protein